jgi:nicotinamide mononucleotide adenylyltransferase
MSWKKKVHVKSTLERKKGQFSLFVGRWQPLHEGHKEMFQQVLDEGGNVLIAIREVEELDSKNPFTALEIMGNIMEVYADYIQQNRVRVMIVPDICSVEFGRGVGYDIIERIPPAKVAEISATKIREEMLLNGK